TGCGELFSRGGAAGYAFRRGREATCGLAGRRRIPPVKKGPGQFRRVQLASLRSLANGLNPSQVCIALASVRLPVRIMRLLVIAARTVSSPIQIAVMLRRSTET